MACSLVPQERLRVFISSAQNNENGFAWSETRKQIKLYLMECPYLNPFIIEDVASGTPSNQLFEYTVQRSDIIVLLVKGEVRKGTATEFAIATKNSKPLLVYFLEDDNPSLGVAQLKTTIETTDYCTYHYLKTFDEIETKIRNEIIEDVIRYYQLKHFQNSTTTENMAFLPTDQEIELSKLSTPTKTAIDMFNSSYEYIFDLLDKKYLKQRKDDPESSLHHLGISALDWLITGRKFDCDNNILDLIQNVAYLYNDVNWLVKRWDAIKYELIGDLERALISEKEALSLAKTCRLPKWIINDILIDCRNIENEVNQSKRQWVIQSAAQAELNESDTIIFLPVLDRYLENVYEELIQDELRINTASHDTMLLGTNMVSVIGNIENYFFSAMLYGSYSHMALTRKALINALYKYAEMTEDNTLFLDAVKLLILNGDANEFQRIIQHKWDNIYPSITSNANDLWRLTDSVHVIHNDSIKQTVLSLIGMYFSDAIFDEAVTYLESFASNIYWGNSEKYFECIQQNISRINPEKVIVMIIEIIREKRFHLGGKLSNILIQLDLAGVNAVLQSDLCAALTEQLSYIVQNNGNPQIIAALEKQSPEIFGVLATVPNNGLIGIQKMFYDINMNEGDWNKVIIDAIETAKLQFEKNNNSSSFSVFGNQPYTTIRQIVRNYYSAEIGIILTNQFFPLCIHIINSQIAIPAKEDCVACLVDVILFYKSIGLSIPVNLFESISQIDASKGQTFRFGGCGTRETFACRVLMLKIIVGVVDKEELLEWCFGYNTKKVKERIALAECLEQFLHYQTNPQEQVDATILSIVLQCFDDEQYSIRQRACCCLIYMLNTKYHGLVERKLYEATVDPSHYVRNYILNLCKNGQISDEAIKQQLIEILANDANYAIRKYANS